MSENKLVNRYVASDITTKLSSKLGMKPHSWDTISVSRNKNIPILFNNILALWQS